MTAAAALVFSGLFMSGSGGDQAPGALISEHLVEETVEVVEVSVLVELPRSLLRPGPQRFLVRDGERVAPVSAVTPLEGEQWRILVYLDAVLTDSDTSFLGPLALARRADELTALGPVTVVVADHEPEVVVEATTEPRRLEEVLAELAGRRIGRDGVEAVHREITALTPEERTPAVLESARRREVATVTRQLQALERVAAERCPGPPCALLLVCSGYHLWPERRYPGAASEIVVEIGARPEPQLERATEALGRELASGGWTVLAVPFRRLRTPGAPARRWTDFDEWSSVHAAPFEGGIPIFGIRPRDRQHGLPLETLDYLILPRYQPLRRLAEATGGTLARAEEELSPLLARFSRRWLLWFTRADGPEAIPSRPLQIIDLSSGASLRAPAWSPPWEGRSAAE